MRQEDHRLGELFQKYKDVTIRSAYQVLGDYHEAEDICQEAFLRLKLHLDRVEEGSEKAWLMVVARNLSRDRLRKGGKSGSSLGLERLMEAGWDWAHPHFEGGDLTELLLKKERGQVYRDALRRLEREKVDLYTVFSLSSMEQHSNKEIAEILGIGSALVSKRKERARAYLAKWIREEMGEG